MARLQLAVLLLMALFSLPAWAQTSVPDPLVGEWRGRYTCAQGDTGLALTFNRGSGGALGGVFAFQSLDNNPDVPSGSFQFSATTTGQRNFAAKAGRWIDQPANYVTVDFSGTVSADGNSLSGRILNSSCGHFRVTRVAASGLAGRLLGEWQGTYTCGQGQTGLILTFAPRSASTLEGVFSFYPTDGNPQVPTGSFDFTVGLERDQRSFLATAGGWIRQPPDYVTVDFSGTISSEGNTISGQILNSSCSAFQVTRSLAPAGSGNSVPDAGQIVRR